MKEAPRLKVAGLKISFETDAGEVTAVRGIDFELRPGETLGIVGESGSGKSVTALSLLQLLGTARVEGEICFAGHGDPPVDLLQLPEPAMRAYRGKRLAMIFQEPMTSLNPVYSCGEQIAETMRRHLGYDRTQARDQTLYWLRRVQLSDAERIYDAYPHQLSGGQKQRVMIAMALCCSPDILIADEPTTALDVTVQRAILDLIVELRDTWNGAAIFISHDLAVIAEVADRVLVMKEGQIVEEGRVEQLFRQPQHPYTAGLLACRPPLDYRPRRLPVIDDFAGDGPPPEVIFPAEIEQRLERLAATPPLLRVKDLYAWFPLRRGWMGKPREYVKAVNGVSFEIHPGETLGLVGESGCGKTTLGRALLQLIPAHSGSVRYKDRELTRLTSAAWQPYRRELQIVFQDPYSSLNPRQTIGAAIVEPMRVHGLHENDRRRKERALDLLETVQLSPDMFHRYPAEFSGGQRQRICIARALALEPVFLICDESVSSLDVSIQAQILNLLMDLRERFNLTMLFISHDLAVVKVMSDRLMIMNQGKIEEIGPAEQIYRNPQTAYTQKLIEALPRGIAE